MNYQDQVMWNLVFNIRQGTLNIVAKLDESMVDLVPPSFKNSIRWNVGHLIYDQELWFHYLIQDEMDVPAYYEDFFGFGTSPATWSKEPPTWKELIQELEAQPGRLHRKFNGRLDEALERVTEAEMSTLGEIIPRTLYHEGLHQGVMIALLKNGTA